MVVPPEWLIKLLFHCSKYMLRPEKEDWIFLLFHVYYMYEEIYRYIIFAVLVSYGETPWNEMVIQ